MQASCRQFPKIGKDPVREPECPGQLQFFLKRIADRTDLAVCRFGDPAFEAGPKGSGQDGVIAAVQNPAWIFSEPIERSKMSNLRESGEISVKVRERFSHLVELIEIITIPWQRWRAAMGSDHIDSALEG